MDDMASGSLAERRERWMSLVAQWRGSGKSRAAFCRERRLPVWKLNYWSRRGLAGGGSADAPVFAAVSSPGSGLRLSLPGGASLEIEPGFDEATLLRLLRVAGAAC